MKGICAGGFVLVKAPTVLNDILKSVALKQERVFFKLKLPLRLETFKFLLWRLTGRFILFQWRSGAQTETLRRH